MSATQFLTSSLLHATISHPFFQVAGSIWGALSRAQGGLDSHPKHWGQGSVCCYMIFVVSPLEAITHHSDNEDNLCFICFQVSYCTDLIKRDRGVVWLWESSSDSYMWTESLYDRDDLNPSAGRLLLLIGDPAWHVTKSTDCLFSFSFILKFLYNNGITICFWIWNVNLLKIFPK